MGYNGGVFGYLIVNTGVYIVILDLEYVRSKFPRMVSSGRDRNPILKYGLTKPAMARLLGVSNYMYNRWELEPDTQPDDIENRVLRVFIEYDMFSSWKKGGKRK